MQIYSPTGEVILDKVDDRSYRYQKIMGQNNVTVYVPTSVVKRIPVGSYLDIEGKRYTLERRKNIKKNGLHNLEYTLIFEDITAKLGNRKVRNTETAQLKFPYTAKPKEHLQLICDSYNRHNPGTFAVGQYIEATEQYIAYDHTYCIDAVQNIADAYNTEWEVTLNANPEVNAVYLIHLRKVEYNKNHPLPLSYREGFKPGVERTLRDDEKAIDVLCAQGGDRNIDLSKYGSKELLLPKGQRIKFDGEKFEDEDGFSSENAREYQVDPDGLYIFPVGKELNFIEDSLDCSHIYPQRVGEVTKVETLEKEDAGTFTFYDETLRDEEIDFNQCRIAGEKMYIRFESGMLVSREFDLVQTENAVTGYDKEKCSFRIIRQEHDGIHMPGELGYIPKVGDKYAVFGMNMPDEYICHNQSRKGASWDMLRECVRYLFDNEHDKFSFTGKLVEKYLRDHWETISGKLVLGSYIDITDAHLLDMDGQEDDEEEIQESALVRIVGIKEYLNKPYNAEIELSNATLKGSFSSQIKQLENQEVVVEDKANQAIKYAKRNFRDVLETMTLLEKWNTHYSGSINPITIHTMLALFGDEGLQFQFVRSMTSTQADPSYQIQYTNGLLVCPAGYLQHKTLGIEVISSSKYNHSYKTWAMTGSNIAPADPEKGYFLYAFVDKEEGKTTGTFDLTEEAYGMEDDRFPNHYCLMVGILNSEYDGTRSYVDMYGFTEIAPGRITTDRIVSSNGLNYVDLLSGGIRSGIYDSNENMTKGLQVNPLSQDRTVIIKGGIVQSQSGDESVIGCFRGEYNNTYTYYEGDEVTHTTTEGTSSYRRIGESATRNVPPTNTGYWQIISSKGSDGKDGKDGDYYEYRYAVNGSTTQYPAINLTSSEPAGWSTQQPTVGVLQYLWRTFARKAADGTLVSGSWSTPVRVTPYDGVDGKDGADGKTGPALSNRGVYSPEKTYSGTSVCVDVVKYNNTYYIARTDAGQNFNALPTDTSKWNSFGANFESVATGLLFTEKALIAGFNFDNEIIESTSTTNGEPNIVLDGINGKFKANDAQIRGKLTTDDDGQTKTNAHLQFSSLRFTSGYNKPEQTILNLGALMTYNPNNKEEDRVGGFMSLNGISYFNVTDYNLSAGDADVRFSIDWNPDKEKQVLEVIMAGLPTSDLNLDVGQLWNDRGTIKIVT